MTSDDNGNGQVPLAIVHQQDHGQAIAIRAKERAAAAMVKAKTFEQFGMKVIRVKAKAEAAIGKYAQQMGIKQMGHGKVVIVGDIAREAIDTITDIIEEMRARVPPCDPEIILELLQTQRDFSRLLLDTGQAHLQADRNANAASDAGKIAIPFAQGTPLMVAIGKSPTEITQEVEDKT
jgi:hypothetical protein